MASLTIRSLDEEVKTRLRIRAAEHGRSMEAEAREILGAELMKPAPEYGLGSIIHARFAAIGGADDLVIPDRIDPARSVDFEDVGFAR